MMSKKLLALTRPLGILQQFCILPVLGILAYGVSTVSIFLCIGMYLLLAFGVTVGYHRYFSHHSFRTSRVLQFILALVASMTMQRGILWWVSMHRHHHLNTDTIKDNHSPVSHGLYHAHMGWVRNQFDYDPKLVKDLMRYPELIWINNFYYLPSIITIVVLWILGGWLEMNSTTNISGGQLVTWGYFVPMALCLHATFAINSLCHLRGYRRYETPDNSKNNLLVAMLMLGEGWHNNHHKFPYSAKMGVSRYEIDIAYLLLKLLEAIGLVWQIKIYKEKA